MDLTGKHVVVTGASSGIGAEVCRHVASLGARVSLIARNESRLASVRDSLSGEGHRCFCLDLMDPGAIEPTIKGIREAQGPFDGAVYCAGVGTSYPFRMTKPDKLQSMATVNYLSYVEFARCVSLRKMRGAALSIVGVSSVASERGAKGQVAYGSTKAAMNGAMRPMSHELFDQGVRVNNVLPGWVKTEMADAFIESHGTELLDKEFEMIQHIGCMLDPVDVANVVAFLLSDASRYVTGTEFDLTGGSLS
ncbi:SDR family NAD(P)-dependent oxidoreductase [Adlercreutzia sp. ZJ473]|uniref:SDR family NAD(P)-dependent oxidoreductase n=1 Tax=Adlercreutzia sp. ZJ473 TaxID=2722822 RepID=UPI0015563E3D|nr:SDR family oxidoreductase [Adlercreutzia sp. ZJ473]